MRVFKGRRYAQKYDQFTYKEEVKIVAGKHSGVSAFVIGETPHKVHVCLPSGNTSTLYKADVRGLADKEAYEDLTKPPTVDISDEEITWASTRTKDTRSALVGAKTTGVKAHQLSNRGGLVQGLETDTACALRLVMVSFERQGIVRNSSDAYKLFRDFAKNTFMILYNFIVTS